MNTHDWKEDILTKETRLMVTRKNTIYIPEHMLSIELLNLFNTTD